MEEQLSRAEQLAEALRDLGSCGTEEAAAWVRAARRTLREWAERPGESGARASQVLASLGRDVHTRPRGYCDA